MTKCLFKALKAVNLDRHVGLFRSLGYNNAASLKRFRVEHFEKLNLTEHELLRLISLLDLLKETTYDAFSIVNPSRKIPTTNKLTQIRASWSDETNQPRQNSSQTNKIKLKTEQIPTRRSTQSLNSGKRSSSMMTTRSNSNFNDDFIFQRSSTILGRSTKNFQVKINPNVKFAGPKTFLNRAAVQHVRVKSYNYGIPTHRRPRATSNRNVHSRDCHGHQAFSFRSTTNGNVETTNYGKPAEIYVYARKRPLLSSEGNLQDSIIVPDGKKLIVSENKSNLDCSPMLKKTEFQFDQVFSENISNKQIFEQTVFPFLSLRRRPNLTYICFGQTGSGKSHTIFGSKSTDGLLVYCTQLLLHEVDDDSTLICSFYEIYNNQVYDLNNDGKRLFVREDGNHRVNVIGVTEVVVRTLDDLRAIIDDGLSRRHHGKSAFNSNSSRSHAVFHLTMKKDSQPNENSRIIFIDLAGSERATDAQNNQRETRREGAQINSSLLALKECIRSMDMTRSHAPFRQSKLTHILRDSLIGSQTRTCLMANVSPASDCCQCSINTLQYASRIRDISLRHRPRTSPMTTNIPMTFFDEPPPVVGQRDKTQTNFKPTTASTPVQRLISNVEVQSMKSNQPPEFDVRLTKTIDIDWQLADDDDDLPVNSQKRNHLSKSLRSNSNQRPQKTGEKPNDFDQRYSRTTMSTENLNPTHSSYFPMPEKDKNSKINDRTSSLKPSYNRLQLMFDNGNDRQTRKPPMTTIRRSSTSSDEIFENLHSVRTVSMKSPTENPTDLKNFDEKFFQRSMMKNRLLNEDYYDNNVELESMTTNNELNPNSDHLTTYRDQKEFLNNRDDLLTIVSNRLTTNNRRPSSSSTSNSNPTKTQKAKTILFSSTKISSSPRTTSSINKSKKPNTSDKNKTKSTTMTDSIRARPTKSSNNQKRTVPLRSEFELDPQIFHSNDKNNFRRNQTSQLVSDQNFVIPIDINRVNEFGKNGTNENFLPDSNSSPMSKKMTPTTIISNGFSEKPFEHIEILYDRSSQQNSTPSRKPNNQNSWQNESFLASPSKEFGLRVSEQLNALRSLLETRFIDHEETRQTETEIRNFHSSTDRSDREIYSNQQNSSKKTDSNGNSYGFEYRQNTDDDREVARTFDLKGNYQPRQIEQFQSSSSLSSNGPDRSLFNFASSLKMIQPSFSSFSNELNQARVSLTTTSSSSSTINSNLAAKIENHEKNEMKNHENLSSPENFEKKHRQKENVGASSGTSLTTSESEKQNQNNFIRTFPDEENFLSIRENSPFFYPTLNDSEQVKTRKEFDRTLTENEKIESIVSNSPFDNFMNSLKSIREKTLDFTVRPIDDHLIPVAE